MSRQYILHCAYALRVRRAAQTLWPQTVHWLLEWRHDSSGLNFWHPRPKSVLILLRRPIVVRCVWNDFFNDFLFLFELTNNDVLLEDEQRKASERHTTFDWPTYSNLRVKTLFSSTKCTRQRFSPDAAANVHHRGLRRQTAHSSCWMYVTNWRRLKLWSRQCYRDWYRNHWARCRGVQWDHWVGYMPLHGKVNRARNSAEPVSGYWGRRCRRSSM